jgi:CRISPR-associated protein Cas2
MTYIITYDIASPRRVKRVAKYLERVGSRVQKSVFAVRKSSVKTRRIVERLRHIMNRRTDSLRVYPMCDKCAAGMQALVGEAPVFSQTYVVL